MAKKFADYFLAGVANQQGVDTNKAIQNFGALQYYGGTPSEEQATNLKTILGIELPREEWREGDPLVMKPRLKAFPGKVDIAAQNAVNTGALTTDRLRARLMQKKLTEGLTPQEDTILEKLNSTRTPYFFGNLDPTQQGQHSGVRAGIIPDANTNARIAASQQRFLQGMEFKEKALAALEKDRELNRIDDRTYRQRRLQIESTHKASIGTFLQAIMNGEDPPEMNYEDLYNVDLGFGGYTGEGGGDGFQSFMAGVASQAREIQDPEQRKLFVKEQLGNIAGQLMQMINGE